MRLEPDISSHAMLLSRLCHRTFFDTHKLGWIDFITATRGKTFRVDSRDVFAAMVLWFKRCAIDEPIVLIAVDEIRMCDYRGASFSTVVMSILKSLVDEYTPNCRLF